MRSQLEFTYECYAQVNYAHDGKAIQIIWNNLDDSDNEGSDNDSNNFIIFTISIGSSRSFFMSLYQNTHINDKTCELNDNENIKKAYNKLFEMLLTLKEQNVNLIKKIKKQMNNKK